MSNHRRSVTAGALCVVALALAACGTSQLDPEGFSRAVEGICENANRQLGLLDPPGENDAAIAAYLEESIGINRDAADGIRLLRPPAEVADLRNAIVAAMDAANDGLEDAAAAIVAGKPRAAARAIQGIEEARGSFAALAVQAGAPACIDQQRAVVGADPVG